MTRLAWVLLALAAGFAVIDWIGVARDDVRLRWVGKPGAIVLLVGVAVALHPASPAQRLIFVAALLLSLCGDLLLLLGDARFLAGLAAFLAAHLAYAGGFLAGGIDRHLLLDSGLAIAIVSLLVGGRVLGAIAAARRPLLPPVTLYLLAISAMVALAGAGGRPAAIAGACLFYLSDGLIAWNRFVRPLAWARLPVIVTYHLGQAGLAISLAAAATAF